MTENIEKKKFKLPFTSFTLHILAMALMFCDHAWVMIASGNDWLTWIGRLAFPIFAFMIAEGARHTRSLKKYILRMLVFALISEIPFNILAADYWIYPFHQNVLWTFLFALLAISVIEKVKKKGRIYLTVPVMALAAVISYFMGKLLMTDYSGEGVLTVLIFYFLSGGGILYKLAQLVLVAFINIEMLKGLTIPMTLFGFSFDFPQQAIAIFALIPIWLYNGEKGYSSKAVKYINYAFYPAHILLLWGIRLLMGL